MNDLYQKAQKNGSTAGIRPNQRVRLVQCQHCHATHVIPPDCPVEPACPSCLSRQIMQEERREDRHDLIQVLIMMAIGLAAWGLSVWVVLVRWWP